MSHGRGNNKIRRIEADDPMMTKIDPGTPRYTFSVLLKGGPVGSQHNKVAGDSFAELAVRVR